MRLSPLVQLLMAIHMLILMVKGVEGRPPLDVVQCASPAASSSSCTVSNAYGSWPDRLSCTAAQVVYPTTEAEIIAAVAAAAEKKQKMKVVSKYAHSIPKLMCPGGSDGLIISTRDYNQELLIDKESMAVVADSGFELRPLLDALAAQGLALTHSPYWQGVSLGGLLSTGSHGSSFFGKGAAVHEFVIAMRLVTPASAAEGFAKVIELNETHTQELLNAAKVSLGVLGVISKVTLRLESLFKRSISYRTVSDEHLEDEILSFASAHEFGDVIWNPSLRKAAFRLDDRVAVNTSSDGVYDFIGFRPLSAALVETQRILEEVQEVSGNASGKCVLARVQMAGFQLLGYGLRNSGKAGAVFTGYPVIGYNHQIQTSGSCLYTPEEDQRVCAWDPRIRGSFFFESSFSIAANKVAGFIEDVKALRDSVVEGFCGPDLYLGVYMRFVKASTAYLGKPHDAVDIDVQYYRAREKGQPRLLEDVIEEVEQMAAFKYGGVPHWGKNRPVAFLGIGSKLHLQLQRFLSVKQQLDPDSLFSSDWTDFALGLTATPQPAALYDSPGCALEGLCICSQDAHCAPHLGYLCQPGRVYVQARVCRKVLP